MDVNANINSAQCMVTKNHVGFDEFINICTGSKTLVDWTFLDWTGASFVVFIVILLVALIIVPVYLFITDN